MRHHNRSLLGMYTIGIAALFLVGFLLLVVFGAGSYRGTVDAREQQTDRGRSPKDAQKDEQINQAPLYGLLRHNELLLFLTPLS